jgi:hypothetical protein
VQRTAFILFAAIISALLPSTLAAQGTPAPTARPAPAQHEKVQVLVGFAYENLPISVNEQVVYCPVLGQCSVPGTVFTNREGLKGWEGAVSHHFSPGFSLVADATGVYGNATTGFPTEAKAHQFTFLGGPEFSRPHKRVTPYVHLLAGAAHQTASHSGNTFFVTFPDTYWGFAGAAGGGFDVKVSTRFSFRLLQADYLLTRLNNHIQSQPRISAGIIVRF